MFYCLFFDSMLDTPKAMPTVLPDSEKSTSAPASAMTDTPDETYDLELDKAVAAIQEQQAKSVVIQLPDGLKSRAKKIADELTSRTGCDVTIWLGSNFGACDLALHARSLGADLLIHFGHSEWRY